MSIFVSRFTGVVKIHGCRVVWLLFNELLNQLLRSALSWFIGEYSFCLIGCYCRCGSAVTLQDGHFKWKDGGFEKQPQGHGCHLLNALGSRLSCRPCAVCLSAVLYF